ncbi:glycosyltransferase [Marinobacter halotolerans]|uniref:glycosyltransferase n=1 Tax=Marinobacter halotolerans TaxID=1569211 RepID=UPI001CD99DB4|nr:glycosyltransferase [Marinobacter halotolerans]
MLGSSDQPVLFLVPGDPGQRTGGYRYVSHLVSALNQRGLRASVEGLEGRFPIPDAAAESSMDSALSACQDGARVVLDGLAMGGMPGVLERHAGRLELVALVHHPLADETGLGEEDRTFLFASEKRALAVVSGVITTSQHTAERLRDFQVAPERIKVIEPGADTVASAPPVADRAPDRTPERTPERVELRLLCVASLSPRKAQHQLVEALSELQHLPWRCTLAGSTERDPAYSQQLAEQISAAGLGERITLTGELDDAALADHYRNTDLFVLPSLYEGYGMVIDEALAAGLPVITSDGGALASTGNRPGVRQYPAGSVMALCNCLELCLTDRKALMEMADAVQQNAGAIRHWSDAAAEFETVLKRQPPRSSPGKDHSQFDQNWLALREPADHQARNRQLLAQVQDWSAERTQNPAHRQATLQIADLGAGAGSNGVFLSAALAGKQHWTLLDQDPLLLAQAQGRLAPLVDSLDIRQCTLEANNLAERIPVETDLITASALIDLTSAPWLDALAKTAKARQAAVYIVLSYAGEFRLNPEHPDDNLIRSLVNDHQHGDKGSGAALGPDATEYLKERLQDLGYQVAVASSPWKLNRDHQALQAALISGWCEAALEQNPAQRSRIRDWQAARLSAAEQGGLATEVAHHDLFAWPGTDATP